MDWLYVYLACGLLFAASTCHLALEARSSLNIPWPVFLTAFAAVVVTWPIPAFCHIGAGVAKTLRETFWP